MSNSEQSAERKDGSEPIAAADDGQAELKAMLDTIAGQLRDADERHMAALSDMQNRIVGMEREAETMRPRVPDQFAPAFEQIEVAIGQLANRLSDAEAKPHQIAAGHSRTNVSGDETNPWDQEAADALADLYVADGAGPTEGEEHAHAVAPRRGVASRVDEAWLDSRFSEILRGIDYSVSHLKSEKAFPEFAERFDQFERQFAKLFAGVATHDDLASVRQVEAHMSAMVDHLEKTHDHLERLDMIEAQLADVSKALASVQAATVNVRSADDVRAIARAAVEETAQRLAPGSADKHSAADDLRPLIEQLMSESRQGGEHTAALLDTMQQAMVRLLDRIDHIDFTPPPVAPAFPAEHLPMPSVESGLYGGNAATEPFARAPVQSPSPPSKNSPDLTSDDDLVLRSENLRKELVADVRRAKARLGGDDDSFTPASTAPPLSISRGPSGGAAPPGSRPIRPSSGAVKNTSGPSAPSPSLVLIASAVLVALAALWYMFGFGNKPDPVAHPVSALQTPLGANASAGSGQSDAAKSAPTSVAPPASASPDDATGKTAPAQPDAGGPHSELAPATQDQVQGSASIDAASQPRTALPMTGVAVDLNRPVSEAELIQARRHQVMATLSGQLGDAAARPGESAVVPASMVPTEAETEGTVPADAQNGALADGTVKSMPLDMPTATVGPLSLRLAAAKGDPSAQFEVGARFAEGEGVKQNFKEAAKWYQRAADQGFAQAEYRIGTLYERGFGLKADRAQAASWYERAAGQGNIKAMHNLAVLYANQTDRSPDYENAAHWFEEAASRGLPDSQFNLAILYENGLGVKRDLKQAFMWLSIAARAGDADATHRRDILRGKLTAAEIAEVQKTIARWKLTPTDRTVNDAIVAGELWKRNPKNGVNG